MFAAAGIIHCGSLLDSDVADIKTAMAVNWREPMYTVEDSLGAETEVCSPDQ